MRTKNEVIERLAEIEKYIKRVDNEYKNGNITLSEYAKQKGSFEQTQAVLDWVLGNL